MTYSQACFSSGCQGVYSNRVGGEDCNGYRILPYDKVLIIFSRTNTSSNHSNKCIVHMYMCMVAQTIGPKKNT